MPIFVLVLVIIMSLSIVITMMSLAFFAQRKWRKLNPRDKETGERPKNKKKDYLRFQARAYLVTATCAAITVFKPEIAWPMLLIAVGCAAFAGPMWYQYSRVGKQARRLESLKNKKGKPLGSYNKWKFGRRHIWVVPTTTLIAISAIIALVFMLRFTAVSWVWWWLALMLNCITIMTMMLINWRATTGPKKKPWKWVSGAAIGSALSSCILAVTIMVGLASATTSDKLPPGDEQATTNVEAESGEKACDVSISANIPNARHDAEDAFAMNTEVLWWGAKQMDVLPSDAKTHSDLQEDEAGCLSETGEKTLDDLLAATTDTELDELWGRFCDAHGCPTG